MMSGRLKPRHDCKGHPQGAARHRVDDNQIRDVMNEYFANPAVTPEAAQAQFVEIIKNAPK